ncbi:MAG: hypothetical protein R6U50_16670 [Desulfobacterales bacterium]
MFLRSLIIFILAGTLTLSAGFASASDQERARERIHMQEQTQIYGSRLMTPEERTQFHERMRAAETEQDREQIRNEHHEMIQERAKERGITMPDGTPAGEHRMNSGAGSFTNPGGGMGQGSRGGMGHGGRRNR